MFVFFEVSNCGVKKNNINIFQTFPTAVNACTFNKRLMSLIPVITELRKTTLYSIYQKVPTAVNACTFNKRLISLIPVSYKVTLE